MSWSITKSSTDEGKASTNVLVARREASLTAGWEEESHGNIAPVQHGKNCHELDQPPPQPFSPCIKCQCPPMGHTDSWQSL
jgi:hypothetical protein